MNDALIVAAGRSPIGRAHKGSLTSIRADDLAAAVVRSVLETVPGIERSRIDDLICGCALPCGEQGYNLGRVVGILAGLDVPGTTVNRYCSSSLQAARMAFHAIRAGEGDVFVCAGVESVSRYQPGSSDGVDNRNPRLLRGAQEGLPDYYVTMGETAENVALREGVTREEMDAFAARSHQRATASVRNGFYAREIVPIRLPDGKLVTRDDGPRPDTTVETLAGLKPAFREDGRVTAGNSCPLNDGAAALVLASTDFAAAHGLTPLAKVVSTGLSSLEPEYMGLGPIAASKAALRRAKMQIGTVDIVEINEAFAAQVIPSARGLGLDPFDERVNPFGGAIALGHPFGMTGVRLICTLLNGLRARDGEIGLATLCVGGGMGMALIIQRLA